MDKGMAEELESKHAALHALIEEEEHRTHPDEDLLHRLKKEKLRLKDELAGHLTHLGGVFGRRAACLAATPAELKLRTTGSRRKVVSRPWRPAQPARGAPALPASS